MNFCIINQNFNIFFRRIRLESLLMSKWKAVEILQDPCPFNSGFISNCIIVSNLVFTKFTVFTLNIGHPNYWALDFGDFFTLIIGHCFLLSLFLLRLFIQKSTITVVTIVCFQLCKNKRHMQNWTSKNLP